MPEKWFFESLFIHFASEKIMIYWIAQCPRAPGMLLWLKQLLEKNWPSLWTFARTVRLTTAPRKGKMRPYLIKNDTQMNRWRKRFWLVFGLRMGGERFKFNLGWCVYSPSRTLRASSDTRLLTESSNTNARLMVFALSLALDPTTFGIHSRKALDTAQPCQLLKPNLKPSSSHSISTPTNISTQFLLQSLCVCVRVCAYVHVCVCACMCFHIMPSINCFGSTVLYVCIEFCI